MARLFAKTWSRASASLSAGSGRRGLLVKGISAATGLSAGGAFAIASVLGAAAPATAATSAIIMSRPAHVSAAAAHGTAQGVQSADAASGWSSAFRQVGSGMGKHEAAKQAAHQKAARAAVAAKAKAARDRAAAARAAASGDPRTIAKSMLGHYGWSASQFSSLNQLWWKESGWDLHASNPSSGAYGIPQALPGTQMSSAGPDWKTNPATQIKWGLTYIKDRYGSPAGAWAHSQANGWY